MILAVSSSSPQVSVALLSETGSVLSELSSDSGHSASAALAMMAGKAVRSAGCGWSDIARICVDIGPGGFTSTRVGVTFAKVLAWALNVPVATAESFDLISRTGPVAVPIKKGTWVVRREVGGTFVETTDPTGADGYGLGSGPDHWPTASRFGSFLNELVDQDPVSLLPAYGSEPSISVPRSGRVLPGGY